MHNINLDYYRKSDGSLFIPHPKVFFDSWCFEYGKMKIEEKMAILAELVANGLDLVAEVEQYIEDFSPVTLQSLKKTLAYDIFFLKGEDPYSTGFHGYDELPETRLAMMLQTELQERYNEIRSNSIYRKL